MPDPKTLILFNKPFRVLCQFTDTDNRATLADFVDTKDVYPAGRLDLDSEGLTLLTDDGALQARISQPRSKLTKSYWVQVEGTPSPGQISALNKGVELKDGPSRAVSARLIQEPAMLWNRTPPVRARKSVPDSWLEIAIAEGRNRQVRRMTAAVGLPTLRLIRHCVGPWSIADLRPGESVHISADQAWRQIKS